MEYKSKEKLQSMTEEELLHELKIAACKLEKELQKFKKTYKN